jgi:hypothetical protein
MAYNTIDDIVEAIKTHIGLENDGQYDDAIENMAKSILFMFETKTRCKFGQTVDFDITKAVKGRQDKLYLGFHPIASIITCARPPVGTTDTVTMTEDEDNVFDENTDFIVDLEAGILTFNPPLIGGIRVIGTQGYAEIPDDIGYAIVTQTTFLWERKKNLGATNMAIGTDDISYQEKVRILAVCKDVLEEYV